MLVHVSKDKDMKDFQHNLQIHVFLYTVLLKTTNKYEIQLVNINFKTPCKICIMCMYDIKCKGVNVFIYIYA